MENLKAKSKPKNKKPLYILLIFIGVFSLFVYWLLKPSLEANAITEINSSLNIEDVKGLFINTKLT
jgi:hypothetical protein